MCGRRFRSWIQFSDSHAALAAVAGILLAERQLDMLGDHPDSPFWWKQYDAAMARLDAENVKVGH